MWFHCFPALLQQLQRHSLHGSQGSRLKRTVNLLHLILDSLYSELKSGKLALCGPISLDGISMSEGHERRAGDEGSVMEMAASLLGGERDRFGDTDADGDEIISETSTLLPPTTTTQPSPPLAAQIPPEPATSRRNTERYHTDEEGQAAAETHIDPRTWRRRETALSLLLLAGMMAMVLLAVVRAMRGGFSPGLLVGGGLMVVLCAVVHRREVRGRVMRG
ncbi:hypothetical protein V8C44DRAFT_314027 [Trichoderma aethiopicum]